MLPTAKTPESLGIPSEALLAFLDDAKAQGLEFHGAIVLRHGQIACEMAWKPYDTTSPHMLFSLSKSFTSTAVGFAVTQGLFALTDTVAGLLPDKLPENPSEDLLAITVHDLLTMASGLDPASDGVDPAKPDWAKRTLSYPVLHKPGTTFHYNSMNSFLLSEIVQRKTGQRVRDYLMPRLFTPLGIAEPEWQQTPMGIDCGGWGLFLSTRDIAKFGQLLLQDGIWAGKRILPEGWVETATRKQVDNSGNDGSIDWRQGYGYQYWRCRDGHFRGDGMFGQMCWVMPEQDAVVAITAGIPDMGKEADLVHDHLTPPKAAPGENPDAVARLAAQVTALAYPFPEGNKKPAVDTAGQYVSEAGDRLDIAFEGDTLVLSAKPEGMPDAFTASYGCGVPLEGTYNGRMLFGSALRYIAGYGWDGNTLHAVLRTPNAPFARIAAMTFKDDTLREVVQGAGFAREGERVYKKQRKA